MRLDPRQANGVQAYLVHAGAVGHPRVQPCARNQADTPVRTCQHRLTAVRLAPRQANGVQAYLVTLALFFLGWRTVVFSPARVHELTHHTREHI